MEAERERLLSRLKKEIKLLMEESVTKKIIHEDSSTIASLCIVLEQCLIHGYKKPTVSLSSLPISMNVLTCLAKHDEIAEKTLKHASSNFSYRKANSSDNLSARFKSKSLVGHTPRYNWIRISLIERSIVDLVKSLMVHCLKLYQEESLIRNYVTGHLFVDLLSGLSALDYTKTKTPDHFWSDPPAEELIERRAAKGDQRRHQKHPNSSLTVCTPSALHYVTDNDPSSCHARNLVQSLYQSSSSALLFGKNNVTVQKPEGDYQTGYLALHQSGKNFFMKWMSKRFVDHKVDPTFYWDYSWVVYLDDVAYIHAHPYEREGSVVLIGHDGVQRPPVLFPSQTALVDFLTCLEGGLLSESFSMEPRVSMYLTPQGTFPPKSDKKKTAKQASFFVFQIITFIPEQPDETRDAKRKRDSIGSVQSLNSNQDKGSVKKTKEGGSEESMSINSCETEDFHLPTRIGEVCQTMRYQILSRNFYGWLAYCRHLSEVRKHLSIMVYKTRTISYPDLEAGVTPELWESLHDCDVVNDKERVMYYTYYGGIDPSVRPEVWKYILGHYSFGDTPAVRRQKDEEEREEFQRQVCVWEKVEQYILSNDKSKFTAVLDETFDTTSVKSVVKEEVDSVVSLEPEEEDEELKSARSGLTSPASDAYLSATQDEDGDEMPEECVMNGVDPPGKNGVDIIENGVIILENGCLPPDTVLINGVEYSDDKIASIDLNFHRIDKDVQRCDRNYYYFTSAKLSILRRIMCTYVWENLEVGYRQGMCDILAPLLVILDDETLAYSCFKKLMVRMNMNFLHSTLMDDHFANMRSLIQILDSELFEHMQSNSDYSHFYFSYRWFLLDFKRELEYDDVFRVWEGIWSAYHCTSNHFTHFIALALVEHYRDIILDNNMDFTDIIKFFNEMAEKHDGRKILNSARQLVHRLQILIDS